MGRHVVKMLCHHGRIFKPHSKIMIRCCWGGRRKRARARLGHGTWLATCPPAPPAALAATTRQRTKRRKKRRRERQIDREKLKKKETERERVKPALPHTQIRKRKKRKNWQKYDELMLDTKARSLRSQWMSLRCWWRCCCCILSWRHQQLWEANSFCICRSITHQSSL